MRMRTLVLAGAAAVGLSLPAAAASVHAVITAVGGAPTEVRQLKEMIDSGAQADTVKVERVQAAGEEEALRIMIERNREAIAMAQEAVSISPALVDMLEQSQVAIAEVLAVNVDGTDITVFVE